MHIQETNQQKSPTIFKKKDKVKTIKTLEKGEGFGELAILYPEKYVNFIMNKLYIL